MAAEITDQLLMMGGTAAITTGGVVAALRVHILYIREKLKAHDERFKSHGEALTRAHQRIDLIERSCLVHHGERRG